MIRQPVWGMSLTGFLGSSEAQFLKTPMRIVSLDEFADGATHFLDVAEHASVDCGRRAETVLIQPV